MASSVDHYREAERLREEADHWLNADAGWRANLSSDDRIARRNSDLLAAQVEATLALAAATALNSHMAMHHDDPEIAAWREAAGVSPEGDGQCVCDHHGDHAGCDHSCGCA